jgi:DNA-binding GntR family transcriptional regulator
VQQIINVNTLMTDEGSASNGGTLAEQVYRRLSVAILTGELAPGAKISEPALARQYGMSRGPLREALHRLQERKLITRSANQGARIIKPTPEALVELFVVREALEGMAARLAAIHATDTEIAALRVAVTQNVDTVGGQEIATVESDERDDDDFHFAIAQCSRNPMLINLLCGELYPLLRLYRGLPVGVRPRGRRAVVEHERVVSAIEDRDPELSETLMRRHIAAARKRREAVLAQASGPDAVVRSELLRNSTPTAESPSPRSAASVRPRSAKHK